MAVVTEEDMASCVVENDKWSELILTTIVVEQAWYVLSFLLKNTKSGGGVNKGFSF